TDALGGPRSLWQLRRIHLNGGSMSRSAAWIPTFDSAKNSRSRYRCCIRRRDRFGPRYTAARICSGSNCTELRIPRRLFTLRLVPIIPTRRPPHSRHFGVQKHHLRKISPGAAQIGFDLGRLAGDPAVRKHESILLFGWSGRRSDVAITPGMDMTSLEKCRCSSKDEIHMTRDERILEVLAAAV